jgi:[ribosomal protein S5]-alanine N-acetyltransferase
MNLPQRLTYFPELFTERLHLRELTDEHVNDIYELFSNEQVTRFYNLTTFHDLSKAQDFIDWYKARYQCQKSIRWGISLRGKKKVVGTIGFNNFQSGGRANVGYDLHPAFWNHGYVTEALKKVSEFGFTELQVNRIEAEVLPDNQASQKVLLKAGFKKEGLLKEWMSWKGKSYDMLMFAYFKRDFYTLRSLMKS